MLNRRVVAGLLDNKKAPICLLSCFNHLSAFVDAERHRLLTDYVIAGLKRLDGMLGM